MSQVQTALKNGTRRAVDRATCAGPTVYAGAVDVTQGPQPYCTSDAQAEHAVANRRRPVPPVGTPIYSDAHLIDRMWCRGQFNDRQHDTAVRLYSLFVRAGLEPRVVGEAGERRERAPEMEDSVSEARTGWNRVLLMVAGHRQALLHDLCLGKHPGTNWLATVQASLIDIEKPLLKMRRALAENMA